jgi:hypothetical protein
MWTPVLGGDNLHFRQSRRRALGTATAKLQGGQVAIVEEPGRRRVRVKLLSIEGLEISKPDEIPFLPEVLKVTL